MEKEYKPVLEVTLRLFRESLPAGVNGMIAEEGKDRFLIAVNADLSEDDQARAFLHECLHIYNNDFNDPVGDVQLIEARTHAQLRRLLS